MSVERADGAGGWREVAHSAPAGPLNATTPVTTADGGAYRVVVTQVSGPPQTFDLFSETVGFGAAAVAEGSIPTPGDARGALTVGAVKWTGTSIEPYSSQGIPGGGKPDLVGPTYVTSNPEWPGTAGTSAATAHVAGAAVLLRQRRLALGLPAGPAELRGVLVSGALDLGAEGPDPVYGAGMARLDTSAPAAGAARRAGAAPRGAGARGGRRYSAPGAGDAQRPSPRDLEAAGRRCAPPRRRPGAAPGNRGGHGGQRRRPRAHGGAGPVRRLAAAAAVAGLGAALAAGHAAGAPAPASLTVDAKPGKAGQVAQGLAKGGLRIQRRDGRRFQVVAAPSRATALARLPGVAGARELTTAFGDDVQLSQGLERQGADVLGKVADGGAGLTIAVIDLGFGQNLARLQTLGEIPPPGQVETLSFDAANGLAGRNAYGNRTNHGEIVTQTVFDYAPKARYLLVNYHTEADFIAATDALIARRPDIVVHSNSFIEGPFDGTGPTALAVDRAAAAGSLWFNSAGNYALLHWSGAWADADADGDLDWPNGDNWTFPRSPGQPITFALSWTSPPGGPPTDLDLSLERREADGSWTPVAASARPPVRGAADGGADHRVRARRRRRSTACAWCGCRGRRPPGS